MACYELSIPPFANISLASSACPNFRCSLNKFDCKGHIWKASMLAMLTQVLTASSGPTSCYSLGLRRHRVTETFLPKHTTFKHVSGIRTRQFCDTNPSSPSRSLGSMSLVLICVCLQSLPAFHSPMAFNNILNACCWSR